MGLRQVAWAQSTTQTESWMRSANRATGGKTTPMSPSGGRKRKLCRDFNGAWAAVVSQGPSTGAAIACKVSNITAEKWAVVSKVHNYTVDFQSASYVGKNTVVVHCLELHLQASQAEV